MSSVGVTIVSAAVDVPFALAFAVGEGQRAKLVPFIAPGFGGASAGGDGHHDSGMRGSLAFGAGLVDLVPGSALTLSARQILLKGARITVGLGLTLGY
jgi:hypothetical protein